LTNIPLQTAAAVELKVVPFCSYARIFGSLEGSVMSRERGSKRKQLNFTLLRT
jgi:hypothetical protein